MPKKGEKISTALERRQARGGSGIGKKAPYCRKRRNHQEGDKPSRHGACPVRCRKHPSAAGGVTAALPADGSGLPAFPAQARRRIPAASSTRYGLGWRQQRPRRNKNTGTPQLPTALTTPTSLLRTAQPSRHASSAARASAGLNSDKMRSTIHFLHSSK